MALVTSGALSPKAVRVRKGENNNNNSQNRITLSFISIIVNSLRETGCPLPCLPSALHQFPFKIVIIS
jgi:hypothetical protein